MKLLQKILWMILMIPIMSTTCEDIHDPSEFMTVANNTDEAIVLFRYETRIPLEIDENLYFFSCIDSLNKQNGNQVDHYDNFMFLKDYLGSDDYSLVGDAKSISYGVFIIKPHSKRKIFFWGKTYSNEIFIYRIFKESTLRRYTREEIIANDICDKRLFFTGEKLYQSGSIIEIND